MKKTWVRCVHRLPLIFSILVPFLVHSQGGVPLWTNRYDGPGNSFDYASAIAVDGAGNVFVTGSSVGSGSSYDYATIAYSSAGVPLWTNRYIGPGNGDDSPNAIAVDSSGNVFVTGQAYVSSNLGYATLKYSSAGVALWTNVYNGPANDGGQALDIALDNSGNVLVTGAANASSSHTDFATIKYSGAGVTLWTNHYDGPGNSYETASDIAVDASGKVFVAGTSGNDSLADFVTVAYSGAGAPLWTNRYNGPGNAKDQASGIAVDSSGKVFVTGSSYGSGGSSDYLTIAYSNAGIPLWTNRYNGPGNGFDSTSAMAVGANGNVFVTGASGAGSSYDIATIAYSSTGLRLWTNRYNGPANLGDQAFAIAVDGAGNVFVTGVSDRDNNSGDCVTIAYSGAGVPLWTNRYNGPGNGFDSGHAIAVDDGGNVLVSGVSMNGDGSNDFLTLKYSANPRARVELAAGLAGNQLRLNWPTNTGIWTLQTAPALSPSAWADRVPQPPSQINGTNYEVFLPVVLTNEYFRLRQ